MSADPNTTAVANPFLKVYDGVYDLLFNSGGSANLLADIIKVGNRVHFGTLKEHDRTQSKPSVVSADHPELWLYDEGATINPHFDSSSMEAMQNISLQCSTGDYRYGNYVSVINWYMMANMIQWRTALGALRWNSRPFVKNLKSIPIQIGETNTERNNALAGWTTIWRMQIQLVINTVDVIYNEG